MLSRNFGIDNMSFYEHIARLYVTTTMHASHVVSLHLFVDVCAPDRKWVAYSKLYQSLEVDSSVLFQQITSIEYHWHQQELPYQQVKAFTSPSVAESTFTQILYFSTKLWYLRLN